ncbi:hypothetical protein VNO78_15370 [Psophocarpus tetragonolobus]|uniref:Uncharacterized protein n=1 Tax=Psophocarpus tetragonolobus TaxID=3891 RepID=A0AAN9XJJ6_PSOTE
MEETPPSTQDLILSLQQATFMAKQLPSTTNPTHLHQIHSSLHHAHRHLSAFLAAIPLLPPLPAEHSPSSAHPMQVEDDEETIDRAEEKMKHYFIKNKNKRPKWPLSAALAEEKRFFDNDSFYHSFRDYDPYAVRFKALDLLYQFHL